MPATPAARSRPAARSGRRPRSADGTPSRAADRSRLYFGGLAARRAAPALLVGLVVPFVQLHSAAVGLWAFTVFAGLAAAALVSARRDVPERGGSWPVQLAAWSALAALIAAVAAIVSPTAMAFGLIAGVWAIGAALIEGGAWWRMRDVGNAQAARTAKDWRAAAVLTLALGVTFLIVRDEVTLTGLFGAYAVILGVLHAISAFSQAPERRPARAGSRA